MKRVFLLASLCVLGVAGCGYRGGLERPAPILWEDRSEYDAKEKAKRDAEEKAKADAAAKAAEQRPQSR